MNGEHEGNSKKQFVIIGAGPAGLTAAQELTKRGMRPIVLERLGKVGGLARTECYKGYRFDLGGHRFFTKVPEVQRMWREILGADFMLRPRLSRIYYNHKFFFYPLKPLNALLGLGLVQAGLVIMSYLRWQLFPCRVEETFEQWVINRFGRRLFQVFFKSYTEKVWGIPCSELKAEWAAQRIKGLTLKTALVSMYLKPKGRIRTLVEEFHYPRLGPGMMWEAFQKEIERHQGRIQLNAEVVKINWIGNSIESVIARCGDREETIPGDHFISSMPLSELVLKLSPAPPAPVLQAAQQLRFRGLLNVCLILNKPSLFPDNWIYVHDPSVKVGRIQNFKNWSPDLVAEPGKTSLGMEYFASEGDQLWSKPDAELIELGKMELEQIGLAKAEDVQDGFVVRVKESYPVYDSSYRLHLGVVREFVESLTNFQTIGRNGLHRYNNQDHAMLTGTLAVRNAVLGEQHDLWGVNGEQEYHEEVESGTYEGLREAAEAIEQTIGRVFTRLDPIAFGMAVGITTGIGLFLATLVQVLRGSAGVDLSLELLGQFLPGYSVTYWGSLLGLIYGFFAGLVTGLAFAFLRNTVILLSMAALDRRMRMRILSQILDV